MMTKELLKVAAQGEREIVMSRVFNAPRRLVFEAWTKPELLTRWLGVFGGWSLVVCEVDLKVGGRLRYVWRHAKGHEMGMTGVFREIVPPERIVSTELFDDPWYQGEAVSTLQLEEVGDKTTLTNTVLYDSTEIRDGVLRSPMEQGLSASYDNLAEVLESLNK